MPEFEARDHARELNVAAEAGAGFAAMVEELVTRAREDPETGVLLARASGDARQVNIGGDNAGTIAISTLPQAPPRPVVTSALRRDSVVIGRDAELQTILAAAGPGQVVSIHAIDGMAGVGKTALVMRAAHVLAERFPEGQYFIEFNTHAPGLTPADPFHVLATLLTDLGIDPGHIPDTLVSRRDLWRDQLAGRRVLLVFDDVSDHTQIEPLLPPGRDSLVLVTSRRRLIGLDGATPLPLDILDPEAAIRVFWNFAYRHPADTDASAVAEIVRHCGYLPLAIVLLASRLAHHPTWTVTDLANELADTHNRLAKFDAGQRAVRAAFAMSYRALPPRQQRLFRRLGLHPGSDLDAYAAAALAEVPVADVRRDLEALYTNHLIDETSHGRYRFHDLIREYARTLAAEDSLGDNDQAADRLVAYYTRTSHTIGRFELGPQSELSASAASIESPVLSTDLAALAWMRAERPNLLACLEDAAAKTRLQHVVALTDALADELPLHGPWRAAVALSQRSTLASDTIDDHSADAVAMKDLGPAGYLPDGYLVAAELLQQQLDLHPDLPPAQRASALDSLGRTYCLVGDYQAAVDSVQQASKIYRDAGDRLEHGFALNTLGWLTHLTGDYPNAAQHLVRALAIHRELGSLRGVAEDCRSLCWVRYLQGDHATAIELAQAAQALFRELGDRFEEAYALCLEGWMQLLIGDWSAVRPLIFRALSLYREIGCRSGEALILFHLGFVQLRLGDSSGTVEALVQAHDLYESLGNRIGQASALNLLGQAHSHLGDYATATDLTERSLRIYDLNSNQTGVAEALANRGWVHYLQGDLQPALDLLHRASATFQTIQHRTDETETLNRIAAVTAAAGDVPQARSTYGRALHLARRIHNRLEEARALEGIARCLISSGNFDDARMVLNEAVTLYTRLGAPETNSATALFSELSRLNT